jgi:polyisoprenyl-phosphate glycosyltransferase
MSSVQISVVAPVFNEEALLRDFYKRTAAALKDYSFEILLVDDGSRDLSWQIISELSQKDSRVKGIGFSRNFGHQAALTAGLEHAAGEAIVLIDSDLQDPPEVIVDMIRKWQEGFDVVYGMRGERQGETWFKKITATLFYRLLRKSSRVHIPVETGDFRLMSRAVVDALNQLPERVRFLRGLSSWVGYRQTGISYKRDPRSAGETKFPFLKMLTFAFDGISSFSSTPLQVASFLGIVSTGIAFLLLVYSLLIRMFSDAVVKGWTSLMFGIFFMGGIQLLMIGVIGEYVGRIYEEVKRRPLYLANRFSGFTESPQKNFTQSFDAPRAPAKK